MKAKMPKSKVKREAIDAELADKMLNAICHTCIKQPYSVCAAHDGDQCAINTLANLLSVGA